MEFSEYSRETIESAPNMEISRYILLENNIESVQLIDDQRKIMKELNVNIHSEPNI